MDAIDVECPWCHAPVGMPCDRQSAYGLPYGKNIYLGGFHSARSRYTATKGKPNNPEDEVWDE